MNKKSKLLKNWIRTATYLTATTVVVSFSIPLSAGWVRDDVDGHNPRRIQVVFGNTNHGVDAHPRNTGTFTSVVLDDNDTAKMFMSTLQPPISIPTHIEFWVSKYDSTEAQHRLRAAAAASGAEENAFKAAFTLAAFENNVVPATVTFSIHKKH